MVFHHYFVQSRKTPGSRNGNIVGLSKVSAQDLFCDLGESLNNSQNQDRKIIHQARFHNHLQAYLKSRSEAYRCIQASRAPRIRGIVAHRQRRIED